MQQGCVIEDRTEKYGVYGKWKKEGLDGLHLQQVISMSGIFVALH